MQCASAGCVDPIGLGTLGQLLMPKRAFGRLESSRKAKNGGLASRIGACTQTVSVQLLREIKIESVSAQRLGLTTVKIGQVSATALAGSRMQSLTRKCKRDAQ